MDWEFPNLSGTRSDEPWLGRPSLKLTSTVEKLTKCHLSLQGSRRPSLHSLCFLCVLFCSKGAMVHVEVTQVKKGQERTGRAVTCLGAGT